MSRTWRTLAGIAVVGGALLYLFAAGIGDNLVYFLTPSELLAKGPDAYDIPFRLSGQVEPGSVRWDAATLDLRFRLRDNSTSLEVESTGTPPRMFHDGIHVVVEGSMASTGQFQARTLMVKHSNEYKPAPGEGHPEARFPALQGRGGSS